MDRKRFLIEKLNKMGVFYKDNQDIENLNLVELEYLHITEKCRFLDAMVRQNGIA